MKKSYKAPEAITVRLTQILPLASSPLNIVDDGDQSILNDKDATSGADGLVKGSTNFWDNEW